MIFPGLFNDSMIFPGLLSVCSLFSRDTRPHVYVSISKFEDRETLNRFLKRLVVTSHGLVDQSGGCLLRVNVVLLRGIAR
jgi:hypothetical protein